MQARGQELDQVEERRVRPVDVLEDEDRRLVSRAGLDEDAHRLEEAVAVGGRRLRLESEQDREVPGDRLGLFRADEPLDERAQLSRRHVDVVAVEDARQLLHLRRERAVRAALTIRQAAASHDAPPARRDALHELGCEPRLADSGLAEDGDEVGTALELDTLPRCIEQADLAITPDKRRGGEVTLAQGRGRPDCAPCGDRLRLALRRHRLDRLVLDRSARGEVRLCADDDLADRRVLL